MRLGLIESIRRDAVHALRAMLRRPIFAGLVVATLALGLGVNAASLAAAYGILVRPLPYKEPSRVVILNLLFADGGDLGFSPDAIQNWLPRLRTVETAAGYYRRELTVRAGESSAVVPAAVVTDGFFDVLGAQAAVGAARVRVDSPDVVINPRVLEPLLGPRHPQAWLSAGLSISGSLRTVGGVLPADFAFPDDGIGIWLPSAVLQSGTKAQDWGFSKIVARLKPGVTIEQFRDDANRVRLELNPRSREQMPIAILGDSAVGETRGLLTAVLIGALLVLVVTCANVATLFIGRGLSRRREMAARKALGASSNDLVRAVLVEIGVIAVIASVIGAGLGSLVLQVFVTRFSGTISGLHRVDVGLPLALAIAGLTVLVTVLCGAVPAWHAARSDFSPFVRATVSPASRAWGLRRALAITQIALACVLLVGAGLLVRTVSELMRGDHGFEPRGALEAKIVLSDTVLFEGAEGQSFVRDLLERVRQTPGVRHAGFGTSLPPRTPLITLAVRMIRDDLDETRFMKVGSVTPGYLQALGVRFLSGRDFEETDQRSGTAVVILSESLARFYFPDGDAVGRTISRLPAIVRMDGNPRVVGVVSDIKYQGLDSPAGSALYIPWTRRPLGTGYLVVRTAGDPMPLAPAIRRAARELDPDMPVPEVQSLVEAIAQSIAVRTVRMFPAIGFAALAIAVAFVGVLATSLTLVVERRRDLAIRSAIGAAPRHLVWMVWRQGLMLTAVGVAVGLGGAAAAGRAIASLLYGVSPFDGATFAGTGFVVGGGALLIAYLAALRASTVDPLGILKSE